MFSRLHVRNSSENNPMYTHFPLDHQAMMDKEPNKYADLVASTLPVEGPIEEDIPRTMYDHELFCRKSRVNGRDMLRRVLTAYGRYDREVR